MKIKHVTVENIHGIYYAIFNVEYIHVPDNLVGPRMQVGIDIGCSKLAVLSNGQEIPNHDLNIETEKIIQYQKTMSHHKPGSLRYREAQ